MELSIDVQGDLTALQMYSLFDALREVPGLFAAVRPPLPSSEELGLAGSSVIVVSLASPDRLRVLIEGLFEWLAYFPSRDQVAVRMTVDGGTTLEIRSSDTRDQVMERVATLVGGQSAASAESGDGGEAVVHATTGFAYGAVSGDLHIFYGAAQPGQTAAEGGNHEPVDPGLPGAPDLPVTIYLSDEGTHERVEAAVEQLLAVAGLQIEFRGDEVFGSWFRRMRAGLADTARSQIAREAVLTATHAAEARLVLAQDATITATLMQNLPALIASLDKTKDAVIRVGAVLVVKVDWRLAIYQLTPAQQLLLNRQPDLATSPENIARALGAQPVQFSEPPAVQ